MRASKQRKFHWAATTALIFSMGVALEVQATVFSIDTFLLRDGAGNEVFRDGFDSGGPPPSAPNFSNGAGASYALFGSVAGNAESGGRLAIDTSLGTLNAPFGTPLRTVTVNLLTSVNPALPIGLRQEFGFDLTGVFDLGVLPSLPIENVGIRFQDLVFGNENGVVDLLLQRLPDNNLYIRLIELDFSTGTTTPVASALFSAPAGAEQIALRLSHAPDATTLTAGYAFLEDGVALPGTVLGTAGGLYDGELFVRAAFVASTPIAQNVPEPPTVSLLLLATIVFASVLGFRNRLWRRALIAPRPLSNGVVRSSWCVLA